MLQIVFFVFLQPLPALVLWDSLWCPMSLFALHDRLLRHDVDDFFFFLYLKRGKIP